MKVLLFQDPAFEKDLQLSPAGNTIAADFPLDTCLAEEIGAKLKDYDVFIHPYGGYFPKDAFSPLLRFLSSGKGFLCLNGAPARYPCYPSAGEPLWRAEREQVAYLRKLDIHSVLDVDCSEIAANEPNPKFAVFEDITPLHCQSNSQNLVMTPTKNAYIPREWGSTGSMDARIVPLVLGRNHEGEHRSSPVVLLEHRAGAFSGGRWIFINQAVHRPLSVRGACAFIARGTRELLVKPTMPFYHSGETPGVTVSAQAWGEPCAWDIHVSVSALHSGPVQHEDLHFSAKEPLAQATVLVASAKKADAYTVVAEFQSSDGEKQTVTQGFIIENCGRSTPFVPFRPSQDYFTRSGQPIPVLGMTYMSGDSSRAFLHLPNTALWLEDMARMKRVGVNWLRTGIWCNWRTYMLDDGHMDEAILRSIQAFVECAAYHELHVTFTFFTFVPESWEGTHPYLDRRSVEAQKRFIGLIVNRCKGYDNLDWDLINEPYVQDHPTQVKKSWDTLERAAYIAYLKQKYHDDIRLYTEKTRQDSASLSCFEELELPCPEDINFNINDVAGAKNGLVWREYLEFNYHIFMQWMLEMRACIQAYAPHQMVTVGQDEALHHHRPSPLQFGKALDYNCQHTWWLNDHLVWDTVFSKYPGKPLLVQETGIMYAEQANSLPRRSEEELFRLLQKKYAYAFATKCAGAIQWIWNSNYFMNNANESNIGALRCDGSYKKEVDVTKRFAAFFQKVQHTMTDCRRESIAVVFPISNDRSNRNFAQKATMNACTALSYYVNAGFEAVSEDAVGQLLEGEYQLLIIPSPHSFSNVAFKKLLQIAEKKELAIVFTGPVSLDEDYEPTSRGEMLAGTAALHNLARWESLSFLGEPFRFRFGDDEQTRAVKETYNGEPVHVAAYGKSRFYLVGVPLELSEDMDTIASFYRKVMQHEQISPPFTVQKETDGVFISCVQWDNARMYTVINETGSLQALTVTDRRTGRAFSFTVDADDVQIMAIDQAGNIIARYGEEA